MSHTLVIQSFRSVSTPAWIAHCLSSVQQWAEAQGWHYRFVDDSIFTRVPDWYRQKVGDRRPVMTDYARLVLIQEALAEDYEQVIWFDADTLIFDPAMSLDYSGSCAFGREHWVYHDDRGRLRVGNSVHNAVCAFRQGCVVLPFLMDTVLSIMARVDPEHIAPQLVGPKLLTALHNLRPFALLPQVDAFSPGLLAEIVQGEGALLSRWHQREDSVAAANLCASLTPSELALAACERLLREGRVPGV